MAKNIMEKIAKDVGLELFEEFRMKDYSEEYRISPCGVEAKKGGRWEINTAALYIICTGRAEIIKKPWMPKSNEQYVFLDIAIEERLLKSVWYATDVDIRRYNDGLVFKTEEEAEQMAKKVIGFLRKERGLE